MAKGLWTAYLSSGEYVVDGDNMGDALYQTMETHPDDYVFAIVSRDMHAHLVYDESEA